jgi:hypothetical protein
MADIDKIKDRIRKLLNLAADDGAAEGEIDNALRAARRLMLQHQLSEDDVAATPEDLRTPEQIAADTQYGRSSSWTNTGRPPSWNGQLAMAIADFIGTVKVYREHPRQRRRLSGIVMYGGKEVSSWTFYGPADDCELAAQLHEELMLTCATTATLKFGGSTFAGNARDYCDGFARGLWDKIKAAQQAVSKEQPAAIAGQTCTALSIVRATDIALAKRKRADEWLQQECGVKLATSRRRGRSIGNGDAYRQGRVDGAAQSLSRTRAARITR